MKLPLRHFLVISILLTAAGCASLHRQNNEGGTASRNPSARQEFVESCAQVARTARCPSGPFPACDPSPAVRGVLAKVYPHGVVDPPIMTADILKAHADKTPSNREDMLEIIPAASVEDRTCSIDSQSVKVRIYRPPDRNPLPTVVFIHGGGFVYGSVESYDSLTRELARMLPAVVVSVSYRLAPESPYPAAIDDSFAAVKWASTHLGELGRDPHRLFVMGDSAGGNLASVAARKSALAGIHLAAQVLIYPVTDMTDTPYESVKTYGQGYFLTNTGIQSYRNYYLPNKKDWTEEDASPMSAAPDALRQTAPAYFLIAGCDPLSDEALAYAQKLHAAGVPVTIQWESGMTHGFLGAFNNAHDVELGKEATPIYHRLIHEVTAMIKVH